MAAVRYWAVMPAAGSGQRMGAKLAKQYLPLCGKTVIEWSLQPLLAEPFAAVVVVLATQDAQWSTLPIAAQSGLHTANGGATRAASVRAGLASLSSQAQPDDWVLVHDAVRPCLRRSDVQALWAALADDAVGGILATAVTDTLKHGDAGQHITATLPRENLWRALTPQMFRFQVLQRALQQAEVRGLEFTDEAAAVEALGLQPRLVVGRTDNIKITVPEDLPLAAALLAAQDVS